jgi:hypothetical protein
MIENDVNLFFFYSFTTDIDTHTYMERKKITTTNKCDVSFQNKQRWKEQKTELASFILNLRLYSLCVQRKREGRTICVRAHRIERERDSKKKER